MKKTTKKDPSKTKKSIKDLQVNPAKGEAVRGGTSPPEPDRRKK